jgi:erythromycin esterase-like protein
MPISEPQEEATPIPTPLNREHTSANILFSSYRNGESEIYLMRDDGTQLVRLTDIEERVSQPAWSPDGRWIAFVRRVDNFNHEIYVMPVPAQGTLVEGNSPELIRLTNTGRLDSEPAWSPDGSEIAFTSDRELSFNIYVMNIDGSEVTRLTKNKRLKTSWSWNTSPKWSPDGEMIAYRSSQDGNNEIYVMDADGSGQKNLTEDPASDVDPAWSPDGNKIVYVSDREGNEEIFIMDADGSNQTRLTENLDKDTYPAWSPDGELIAFYSRRDGNYEIYVMRPDGSEQTRITHHYNFDGFPAWEPDGTSVVQVDMKLSSMKDIPIPTADPQVVAWLVENATPLNGTEPQEDNDDLAPLGEVILDSRVVDIGEPTLGTHEAFTLRQRLISYLVNEFAFTTLIFEADWSNGLLLNQYIHTGKGDPVQLVSNFTDPRWRTQEMVNLIEWLGVYNQNLDTYPKVNILGVDVEQPHLSIDYLLAYLEKVDPESVAKAGKLYSCLRAYEEDWLQYGHTSFQDQRQCKTNIQQVYNMLYNRREAHQGVSSIEDYAVALHTARVLQQAEIAFRNLSGSNDFVHENIEWITNNAGSEGKFILWGYNLGAADPSINGIAYAYRFTLGSHLRPILGEEPVAIGFAYGEGALTAYDYHAVDYTLRTLPLPPAHGGSFEWYAGSAGIPAFSLLLDPASIDFIDAAWLDQPLDYRLIAESYNPNLAGDYFVQVHLPSLFDAILYSDQVTPSELLP